MAQTQKQGFMSSFGIPTISRQEALKQKRVGLLQGVAGTGSGAATLGAMLGGAFAPQGLNEQEAMIYGVKEQADAEYEALERNPAFAGMSGEQKQFVYQDMIADATAKVNPALASDMRQQNSQSKMAYQAQLQELSKLTAYKPVTKNDVEVMYAVGDNGTYDMGNPIDVIRSADGTRTGLQGNPLPTNMLAGSAANKYNDEYWAAKGGTPAQKEERFFKDNKDQITEIRDSMHNVDSAGRTIARVMAGMRAFVEEDRGKPEEYLGLTGETVQITSNIVSSIEGGMSALKQQAVYDKDGEFIATLDDMVNGKNAGMTDYMQSVLGPMNAKTQANIIELAFAVAKIHEPGGKLSDNDFKYALKRIGGNYNNPQALAATLKELMISGRGDLHGKLATLDQSAVRYGLGEQKGIELAFGDSISNSDEAYAKAGEDFAWLEQYWAGTLPRQQEQGRRDRTSRIFGTDQSAAAPATADINPNIPRSGAGNFHLGGPNTMIYQNGSITFLTEESTTGAE